MTADDSFARRIEWRLIEQSVSKSWILITLNVLLAVLFAVVYLSAGREPMTVVAVMTPRLAASAVALGILIWLVRSGVEWRSANRGKAKNLLILQEALTLFLFGATATVWMLEQDQSVNALSMAGIGAFGAISACLLYTSPSPRD